MTTIRESVQESILGAGVAPKTESAYWLGCSKHFFDYLISIDIHPEDDVSVLTPQTFIKFPSWLNGLELSKASKMLYLAGVTNFFNYLVENEVLIPTVAQMQRYKSARKNVRRLHEEQLPITPSDEEFERFLLTAQGMGWPEKIQKRNMAIILLMRYSGLRISEVADLRKKDVNIESGEVIVRLGKGRKTRRTFINRRVLTALQEYFALRPDRGQEQYIFERHDGKEQEGEGLEICSIRYVINAVRAKCDLGHFHPHTLRHLFVTEVVRKGDIATAQTLAGHNSIQTTRRYLHLADSEVEKAYKRIFSEE